MSFDKLPADVAQLLLEVREMRAEIRQLKAEIRARDAVRPTYDAKQLQALGYSKDEAYAILHSHGNKVKGRLRVTADNLIAYQKGEGAYQGDVN